MKGVTRAQRTMIVERAHGLCEYCQSPENFSPSRFAIEHINPRQAGGVTDLDNLALACPGCNGHKFTKREATDPLTGKVVPLYNPRLQSWHDHFMWSEDASRIIGLSAPGRATIEALHMNRQGVINIRQVLALAEKHPFKNPNEE
jgi:hypothetical protein